MADFVDQINTFADQINAFAGQVNAFLDQHNADPVAVAVVCAVVIVTTWLFVRRESIPLITVDMTEYESQDVIDAPVHDEYILVKPEEPENLRCYDPATLQYLGPVENMSEARVNEIIESSRDAQQTWAKTSFEQRKYVLKLLLRYFVENSADICRVSVRDSGKTKLGAMLGEIIPTCEKLRWIIQEGEAIISPEVRGGGGLLTIHKHAQVEYAPLGVLGVLAPWNYPCHNLMNHIISGIFAGNGVVVKVSEYSSWSADYFIRIVQKALSEAGHNPNLVQAVTGMGPTGAALVSSSVDKVIFTGSDAIGVKIMQGASKNLTPCVLELGGKDPMIICASAKLSHVIPIAMRGVYQNCGQNCIGVERVLVHESLHDAFVDQMLAIVKEMKQAVPLDPAAGAVDMGAMTTPVQLQHVQGLVDDAVSKGATLVIGGKRNMKLAPGLFFEPTILTNVTNEMRIATEEVFGPVCTVFKWSDMDKLVALANSSEYGLASSVFSENSAESEEIFKRLDCGMSNINDFGVNYLVQSLPFGGVKRSGYGKFAGPEGLRACCRVRAVTRDKVSFVQTTIPKPLAYPTTANSAEVADSLVHLAYGNGMLARTKGLVQMLRGIVSA